eukprot:gene972-10740_t
MAAMTLNLLEQMMANGDITVADLASLANTNSQQELYNHEDNAATPGSVDETGFEETETIVSVVTTTPENNLQGLDQYNGEELLAAEFDKEVFLEEVRKYRCLWDIASEGYKIRPMKQNAWSKIGQLFNKDAETALQSEDVLDGPLAPQISVRPVVLSGTKRKASDTPSSCGSQGYKNRQERFDNAILKELESTNNAIKSVVTTDNEDEVSLYCKSIIPIISSFSIKKKRLAMIKVSQLLFELEFEHE